MKLRVNFKQIFKKKFIKYFILNVTLPVIIFYFLFEKVDLQSSYDILKKANLNFILIGIFLSFFQVYLNNLRWFFIIAKNYPVNFYSLLRYSYIISFLNQVLPSSIGGEAYKVFVTNKITKSFSKSLSIIIFEKFFVLFILLFLILLTSYLFNKSTLDWITYLIDVILFAFISMLALILFIILFKKLENRHYFMKRFKLGRLNSFNFLLNFDVAFKTMIVSLFSHLNLLIIFKFIMISLGIHLNIIELSFVFFIIFLLSQLPISIGGWGVRETSTISILYILGIDSNISFIISALFGMILLISYLPAIYLMLNSFNFSYLKKIN